MATNKFAAYCVECNGRVPAHGGKLTKVGSRWEVRHLACSAEGGAAVHTYSSPMTGWSGTRNARGRCEDAPCCGCCTF